MIDQNLVSYIKESLNQGCTRADIENALLSSGWKKEMIDEGFNSIPLEELKAIKIEPSSKKSLYLKLLLIVFSVGIGAVLVYIVFILYFTTSTIPVLKKALDNFPLQSDYETNNYPISRDNAITQTSKLDSEIENNQSNSQNLVVAECGSISYKDYVFFSLDEKFLSSFNTIEPPYEVPASSLAAIECINDALLNCKPAKFEVEGTTINPVFPEDTNFNFETQTYNISKAEDTTKCMFNECTLPKDAITHRSSTEKQELFSNLIGFKTGTIMLFNGREDMYDTVTNTVIKNVCPPGKNPYF
ncbi:hypothetical protein IPN41_02755 [Candidatus Falkowbacteria bacterium]|nr:MAG: hypothetical protein IPN41_02755 [Candidatus Falkowbacteria bacterium]